MNAYCPPLEGRIHFAGTLLDFNERGTPPSPKVCAAVEEFLRRKQLNRYPEYFDFCERVAEYAQVKKDQVMITNGSDQGIDLIFRTFTQFNDEIIIPSPSFAMFFQCANAIGNRVIMPAYRPDDFSFPYEAVLDAITPETKLIVLCNPNNPTGTPISPEQIENILRKAPNSIVYVDEAYYEFSGITAVPLIQKYPNIIITRTFSKAFGLAALRVGYVLSDNRNIEEMLKLRGPYDVNALGYHAAKAALEDRENTNEYVDEIMNHSKPMVEDFFRRNDIEFFESSANFLLFRVNNDSNELFEKLKKNGFLLRPRDGGSLKNTFRVTMGTSDQMRQFCNIFSSCI
jgi:histidinol-phosphate aminotransferase